MRGGGIFLEGLIIGILCYVLTYKLKKMQIYVMACIAIKTNQKNFV